MKYDLTRANNMEKSSAAVFHLKASPVKPPSPIKPQCPPACVRTVLFSLNNTTGAVHNKENSKEHDATQDGGFEDSGYLSLHNSQIDDHHGDEEDHVNGKSTPTLLPCSAAATTHKEKTVSPKSSPTKCQGRTNSIRPVAPCTPVDCPRRRAATYSLSSTPSSHNDDPNLPILRFQRAVCAELAKGYQKNKCFDWSIVSKVAEDHLLDRVIGGNMGLEYIDVFSSLLSLNMRSILTNILTVLGDMDLISCRKVSRTWRKIICEDREAMSRCQQAEQSLKESVSSVRRGCGLTRDMAVSRVVLSCMQTLASSTPVQSSSSSSSSNRVHKRTSASLKGSMADSQCPRFKEYMRVASGLKQHESLRPCKRCGSPAKHLAEAMRATCTRENCQYDFCTHCQEAFHGSSPCRTVQPRPHFSSYKTTQIIPGSAHSKRNVKRL